MDKYFWKIFHEHIKKHSYYKNIDNKYRIHSVQKSVIGLEIFLSFDNDLFIKVSRFSHIRSIDGTTRLIFTVVQLLMIWRILFIV